MTIINCFGHFLSVLLLDDAYPDESTQMHELHNYFFGLVIDTVQEKQLL